MSIKPPHVRHQIGISILPPKAAPPATPYASHPEAYLAMLLDAEAVAIRKRHRINQIALPPAPHPTTNADAERQSKSATGLRRTWAKRNAAVRERIMEALGHCNTSRQIGDVIGLNATSVAWHLSCMKQEGLVALTKSNRMHFWRKVAQ
jgi:hypothetical protein